MEDFDDAIMRPLSGSETLEEYYRNSGCLEFISSVAIPVLVAHADDDPVVPHHMLPEDDIKANPNLSFIRTASGGHTGWLSGWNPRGSSWFDHVALEWISLVLRFQDEHDAPTPRGPRVAPVSIPPLSSPTSTIHTRSRTRIEPQQSPKIVSPRSGQRSSMRERRPTSSRLDL
jgi:hypothetical protein